MSELEQELVLKKVISNPQIWGYEKSKKITRGLVRFHLYNSFTILS